MVELPHLHNSTQDMVRGFCLDLQRDHFIDGATRAVAFEMVLLSPSEDHFAVVSMVRSYSKYVVHSFLTFVVANWQRVQLLEFSLSGAIVSSTEVNVCRLHRSIDGSSTSAAYLALQLFVALSATLFCLSEWRQVNKFLALQ